MQEDQTETIYELRILLLVFDRDLSVEWLTEMFLFVLLVLKLNEMKNKIVFDQFLCLHSCVRFKTGLIFLVVLTSTVFHLIDLH